MERKIQPMIPSDRLPDAGSAAAPRKVFVERSLEGELPAPGLGGITFASLHAMGEDLFVPLLSACAQGDPFEAPCADPWASYRELKEHAGQAFEPRAWQAAFLDRAPCGVALPHLLHDEPGSGTIFYLGVLPAFRGRGIGRHLHREGLRLLAALGAMRYKGSADARNAAMLRIFAANGCAATKGTPLLRPAPHEGAG